MGSCASLQSPHDAENSRPQSPEGQQPFRNAAKRTTARRNRHRESTFVLTDDVVQQLRNRPTPTFQELSAGESPSTKYALPGGGETLRSELSITDIDDTENSIRVNFNYSCDSDDMSPSDSFVKSSSDCGGSLPPLPQTSGEIGGLRAQLAHKLPPGKRMFYIE